MGKHQIAVSFWVGRRVESASESKSLPERSRRDPFSPDNLSLGLTIVRDILAYLVCFGFFDNQQLATSLAIPSKEVVRC